MPLLTAAQNAQPDYVALAMVLVFACSFQQRICAF